MRPDDMIRCSFCGRARDQVRRMIAGADNNNMYIYDKCMELCSETLGGELEGQDEEESPTLVDIRLLKPKKIKAFSDEYVIEQDNTKKMLSVAAYNHYKGVTACQNMDADVQKSNVLVVGSTGSGKTYLTQILAKVLNIPFAIADATVLAEAGYAGKDVENILLKLIQAVDYNISRAEYGIIYIDEIDKVTKKPKNVSITRDVSGEDIQQTLLKTLEGIVINAPPQGGRKHPHQELLQTDITNILFIRGGASDSLEKIVEQRLSTGPIGLSVEVANKNDPNIDELLGKAELKDLIKLGLIPELTGRVLMTALLKQLTRDVIVYILPEPKNALMRQYQKLFELGNVKLEFVQEVLEEITQLVVGRKVDVKGLHSILESVVMDLMYKIPFDDSIGVCTTTRDIMEKVGQPELVYRDTPSISIRESLSERLRGDNKIGEITQAVVFL